ncbi:AraC family transcriptional regulator [Bacillus horti]|uniref:YesN/AraC family two-component response regulator n=1 Tax=Caldalkalibacillus horti TaxID=77523 RepID=A0ABT9W361_9BACI|nr:AraC family transcriptional regulator [Bacillus horti]MDQ0167509.1 YesN/AraC family two-component response regulator [Bacillus horti]
MSILTFISPPFPTFIKCEEDSFAIGQKHMKRSDLRLFDLLYVKKGELFITEDEVQYEVEEGEYVILSPMLKHYGHLGCKQQTDYYWLHFQMQNECRLVEEGNIDWSKIMIEEGTWTNPAEFLMHIPKYKKIKQRETLESMLQRIVELDFLHAPDAKLRQQILFGEFILFLQKEALSIPSSAEQVSQKVLAYIHGHFQEPIKMEDISQELLFHPDYITRCMQYSTGMTPTQYLAHYRMSVAKHLLSTTNEKMTAIAKEVGITDSTYFTKLFKKIEGITPIQYRRIIGRKII